MARKSKAELAAEAAAKVQGEAICARVDELKYTPRSDLMMVHIDKRLEQHAAGLESWIEELRKDPMRALEWSDRVFANAAKVAVLREMRRYCEGAERFDVKQFRSHVREQVLTKVSCGIHISNSIPSNFMAECLAAEMADVGRSTFGMVYEFAWDAAFTEATEMFPAEPTP